MRPVNGTGALPWLAQRAEVAFTPLAKAIAAVDDAGRVRGMIGYDNFTRGSCEVHIAIETPLALRGLIPECFRYAFDDLRLRVVVGVTPANNTRALALNKRLGFTEVHRVRDGWAEGVDMVIQELRAQGCAKHLRNAGKAA